MRAVSTSSGWEDDLEILPDVTEDEHARGWGDDLDDSNDQRLLDERPPHWDGLAAPRSWQER
jgi:hypothetical protein